MGCGESNEKLKNIDEKKDNEKNKKIDYNSENVIKGEKRPIPVNEKNRILKKVDTICKILKGNEEGSGFFCKINIKGQEMKLK